MHHDFKESTARRDRLGRHPRDPARPANADPTADLRSGLEEAVENTGMQPLLPQEVIEQAAIEIRDEARAPQVGEVPVQLKVLHYLVLKVNLLKFQ